VLLNTKMRMIGYRVVSVGSLNEAIAHPREIFRAAILAGAYALVLMHNHPSAPPRFYTGSGSEASRSPSLRAWLAGC
jgi:DNA repair protein RadC